MAYRQCKALGIDYEKERPKLNDRQRELFNCFSALNRRRIEHNPLQKADILEEVDHLDYSDKSLFVIESIDSHWLAEQAKKIKRRMKQ